MGIVSCVCLNNSTCSNLVSVVFIWWVLSLLAAHVATTGINKVEYLHFLYFFSFIFKIRKLLSHSIMMIWWWFDKVGNSPYVAPRSSESKINYICTYNLAIPVHWPWHTSYCSGLCSGICQRPLNTQHNRGRVCEYLCACTEGFNVC